MEQVFAFMSLIINYALARSPTRWVNSAEPPMVGAPAAAAAAMNAPSYLTNDFKKNKQTNWMVLLQVSGLVG